jgi:hypothetical protein
MDGTSARIAYYILAGIPRLIANPPDRSCGEVSG